MSVIPRMHRLRLTGCLACLALATTLQAQPWKFVVLGDSLTFYITSPINTNLLAELAPAIVEERPDFVLFTGDFAGAPSLENFQVWTNTMAPIYQAGISVYPAVGNHDYQDPAAYQAVFGPAIPDNGPPEEIDTTYALIHRNALILVLNEFTPTNSFRVNQAWLDAVLATNTQPHVFAAGHLTAFKVYHGDCMDDYPTNRNAFWQSLERAGCRIYFCGHDHFYDHSRVDNGDGNPNDDLHQIAAGTGGAPLYPDGLYDGDNGTWQPVRAFHEAQYGFVSVTVDGATVTTTWHHRTEPGAFAATPEVFSYTLSARPLLRFGYKDGGLTLTWPGNAILQSAHDPHGVFTNVPGAASPWSTAGRNGQRMFFRLKQP